MKKPGSPANALALEQIRARKNKRLTSLSVQRALNPATKQGERRADLINWRSRHNPNSTTNMERGRGYAMPYLIARVLGITLPYWIGQRKNLVVTEIGAGKGNFFKEVRNSFLENIGKTVAMDSTDVISAENAKFIDEKIVGDALKEKIPKSDLIVSSWSLGYIGHPDFMARKIAKALNPNGMAILHFNTEMYSEGQPNNFSTFLDLLSKNRIILPGCTVTAKKVDRSSKRLFEESSPNLEKINVNKGDYLVAIIKNPE